MSAPAYDYGVPLSPPLRGGLDLPMIGKVTWGITVSALLLFMILWNFVIIGGRVDKQKKADVANNHFAARMTGGAATFANGSDSTGLGLVDTDGLINAGAMSVVYTANAGATTGATYALKLLTAAYSTATPYGLSFKNAIITAVPAGATLTNVITYAVTTATNADDTLTFTVKTSAGVSSAEAFLVKIRFA